MNKNLIVGIAAGAAALAVASLIARRTGTLDAILDKIHDLADSMQRFDFDKYGMGDVIPKGEDKNVSKSLSQPR